LIKYLLSKFKKAAKQHNIKQIAIAGGVSANSGLRKALSELSIKERWSIYVPEFEYCTDNAGMIAMTGYFKYLKEDFAPLDIVPSARMGI